MLIQEQGQRILDDVKRVREANYGLDDRRLATVEAVGTVMAAGIDPSRITAVGERSVRCGDRVVQVSAAVRAAVWLLAEVALEEEDTAAGSA
jgi:hypothetical protein